MPTRPASIDGPVEGSELLEHRRAEVLRLRQMLSKSLPAPAAISQADTASLTGLIGGEPGPRQLIDFLAGARGSGAGLIALALCIGACRRRGELVVIDAGGGFFPSVAIAWGAEARRLLVVNPTRPIDALAAAEQALRSPAVGAVWVCFDRGEGRINGRAFRRLLLAAEAGEAFGAIVRSAHYQAEPSWAHRQLRIDPTPGDGPQGPFSVRATLTRNRHGPAGGQATLAMDWSTGRLNDTTSPHDDARPNADDAEETLRLVS